MRVKGSTTGSGKTFNNARARNSLSSMVLCAKSKDLGLSISNIWNVSCGARIVGVTGEGELGLERVVAGSVVVEAVGPGPGPGPVVGTVVGAFAGANVGVVAVAEIVLVGEILIEGGESSRVMRGEEIAPIGSLGTVS